MKTIYFTLCLLMVAVFANAQETMYVMKNGAVVYSEFVDQIDSVIFYNPNANSGYSINIDGDFSDWNDIAYATNLAGAGSLQSLKYKVEGKKVFMLLVGTDAMALGMIQVRFDIDNDPTTGWNPTGQYGTTCGIELRGVGPELYDRRDGSALLTTTAPWFERSTGVGTLTTGEYAVEIAYDITAMETLLGASFSTTGFGFGLIDHPAWNNWNILGSLPALNSGYDLFFIPFE